MRLLLFLALSLLFSPAASGAPYTIDRHHAHVSFAVDHVGFSTTRGRFREFSADVDFDPGDPLRTRVTFTIDAGSIDTESPLRDTTLRGPQFLDTENHTTITFIGRDIDRRGEREARLTGDLTMRGVTRRETFDVKLRKLGESELTRRPTAGFEITGVIDRRNYGMTFGAPAIGAEVSFVVDLEIYER